MLLRRGDRKRAADYDHLLPLKAHCGSLETGPTRGGRGWSWKAVPYEFLDNPAAVGGRIHFRYRQDDDDPTLFVTPATLATKEITWAYVNGTEVDEYEALNSLGSQLRTDNPPYDPAPAQGMNGWYRFMDDLETLSEKRGGLVIIIDDAADLFADPQSWAFNLIEIWVQQLPGWQRRKLPCHLAFQMEADPCIGALYGHL